MPVKDWFRKLQPVQLYIVLVLSVVFFITELVCSHVTHALTLLMDSYHMLCNILALTGCIVTIKYGKAWSKDAEVINEKEPSISSSTVSEELSSNPTGCRDNKPYNNAIKPSPARTTQEKKLKNTFGWARIDVISLLICCIFMASLCFSVFVEAVQTLVHIDHLDEMHHPLSVLFIGSAGLLLNGLCYLLIGGYTFHQGSFLYVTESGDVILNKITIPDLVRQGGRRLSRTRTISSPKDRQRQGFLEMCKDVLGCVFVIICALVVYFSEDKNVAKYVDPVLSLVSAITLMFLSYPYMKESCLILLQTIPGSMDIDVLTKDLLQNFPGIADIHDFHIWQLTATKIISTVHIIFQNQKGSRKLMEDIRDFLIENGITQVTIQPEYFTKTESTENIAPACLMLCQGELCKLSHCCPDIKIKEKKTESSSPSLNGSIPDLKSIKVIDEEVDNSKQEQTQC